MALPISCRSEFHAWRSFQNMPSFTTFNWVLITTKFLLKLREIFNFSNNSLKKIPDFFVIRKLIIDWSRTRLYNTFHYKTQLQNTFFIVIVVFIITRLHRKKKLKHFFIIPTLHTTPLKRFFLLFSALVLNFHSNLLSAKIGRNESAANVNVTTKKLKKLQRVQKISLTRSPVVVTEYKS